MRVLSLFDGISCARQALTEAGVPVDAYYASEVDPKAIQIAMKNYPDTIQLGDIRTLQEPPTAIDLLVGGSPCIDLSIAKANRKGLEGKHSSLFWEYVRIYRIVKPRWFILENVASMPKKDRDIITQELQVEPVMFDAALVSAQSRKRLFWTNIRFQLPADQGILLKNILQPDAEVDESMTVKGKSFCLTASYHKVGESQAEYEHNKKKSQRTMVKLGHIGNTDGQSKSATLSANSGAKTELYAIGSFVGRRLNEDGHRQDGNHDYPIQRRLEVRSDNKSGTLTSVLKDNLVVGETRVRKLTPIECERLQGLPDDYTAGVPKTHRYKCLGNGFCVPVITHILRSIP
jgi:DNA (cytosine-5)-methyltransferase 3A